MSYGNLVVKTEFRKLSFRYPNQQLIYPGMYEFTWLNLGYGVSFLIEMKHVEDK